MKKAKETTTERYNRMFGKLYHHGEELIKKKEAKIEKLKKEVAILKSLL